mgnify:CR=1 FL=1
MASHQLSGDNAVDTTALFLERKEVFASSFTKNKYFDFINSSAMHFYFYFCFFFFPKLGKAYFDLQQSGFDTASNNGGCFKVENLPVSAKDLETIRNVKSTSRAFTELAKGMKKETCKLPFLYSPHLCESSVVLRVTKQLDTQN